MADQPKAVFFLSDAHLGSGPHLDRRRRTLVDLLHSLKQRASHVYVLGDLFDFWFEYRHAIPKGHFRVLRALADLVDSGIPVAYFGGNHDFWCGTHLSQEVGLAVRQQPGVVHHQGRRIYLAHGDGLGTGDVGYRLLKKLLRHPWAIALYRTIHPDVGIPFAYRVSKISREHCRPIEVILAHYARHLAAPRYAAGDDAIVIGHVHTPTHLRDEYGRDFLIVGDWLESFTYVRLEHGTFHLEKLDPAGEASVVEPLAWPPDLVPAAGNPARSGGGAP